MPFELAVENIIPLDMAAKSLFDSLVQRVRAQDELVQQIILYSILSIVAILVTVTSNSSKTYSKEIPLINPSKPFSIFNLEAKVSLRAGNIL